MDNVVTFADSIKEKYKERRLNRDKQWPPCDSKELVKLELVEGENIQKRSLHQRKGEVTNAKRTPLAYGDLFKVDSGKRIVRKVLIEGDAGIGKTTFCTSAAEDWANGKLFNEFELLLLIPLRHKKVASISSLPELLKLLHSSKKLCSSIADYLEENEGRKTLIIGDGWDELSESCRQVDSFMYELFFGELLPSVSVVLTSRYAASAVLHRHPHIDKFVEVCGFSSENVKQYIRSEFASSQEEAKHLLEQLERNPLVQSVCSIPLNCAIICHLWRTFEKALPTTMTELYTNIILNVILRNIQKIDEFQMIKELNSFDAIPDSLQQAWWNLCEFAFEAMKMNAIVFSEKDLNVLLSRDLISDKKILCFGLLRSAEPILETGCGVSFHFLHLTFQEYLAAMHLVRQIFVRQPESGRPVGEPNIFHSLAKSKHFAIVWRFFFGLSGAREIGYKNARRIQSCFHFLSKFNFEYFEGKNLELCHCAFEANNDRVNNKMLQSLKRNSPLVLDFGNPHTAHDCAAVLYVIAIITECNGMEINFSDCGIAEHQITKLTDTLARGNGKLQIQELRLKGNKLPERCLKNLFQRASIAFHKLQVLNLEGNGITSSSIECIFSKMSQLPFRELSDLNLSHNAIGVTGLQALGNSACDGSLANLKQLYLQGALTKDADINGALLATSMDTILSHCPHLMKLDLSQNKLGSPGGSALGKILSTQRRHSTLPPSHLQEGIKGFLSFECEGHKSWCVNISETSLGDDGLCAFVEGLEAPCHLHNLQLNSNNISATGVSELADSISCERIVVVQKGFILLLDDDINLDNNPLGLESSLAIGRMLSSGRFDHNINVRLSRCQLTRSRNTSSTMTAADSFNVSAERLTAVEIKKHLCQLPQSDIVTWLILDHNNFSGEGIHVLAGFLYLCPNLESLDSSSCEITSDDLRRLLDQLHKLKHNMSPILCSKLKCWNLSNNEIDNHGVSALIDSLSLLFPCLGYDIHGRLCLANNYVSRDMMKAIDEEMHKHKKEEWEKIDREQIELRGGTTERVLPFEFWIKENLQVQWTQYILKLIVKVALDFVVHHPYIHLKIVGNEDTEASSQNLGRATISPQSGKEQTDSPYDVQATDTCSSVSQMDPPSMQPPTNRLQGDTMLVSEKEGFEKNIAPLIIERAKDLESNPNQRLDEVVDFRNDGVSKHLGQIADSMHEWEGAVAEELGLTRVDIAAITKKHPGELNLQTRAALEKWKQRLGSKATYNKLIGVFECAGYQGYADTVRQICGETVTGCSIARRLKVDPNTSTHNNLNDAYQSVTVERIQLTVEPIEDPARQTESFEPLDGNIFFTPPSSPTLSHRFDVSFGPEEDSSHVHKPKLS